MKKILFATLMFLGVAVVSNAKTFVKTTTHKNTTSTVSPAAASLTKAATGTPAKKHKKHKKHHKAPKNEPKK